MRCLVVIPPKDDGIFATREIGDAIYNHVTHLNPYNSEVYATKLSTLRNNRIETTILNLGSGSNPEKNILISDPRILNVDIEKSKFVHVVCDAHFLPFRKKVFSLAILSHVLEHIYNPLRVLEETKKVTSNTILILIPNSTQHSSVHESPDHIYSWNAKTLENLLHKVYPHAKIDMRKTWRFHPKIRFFNKTFRLFLSFFQPNEITAKIILK